MQVLSEEEINQALRSANQKEVVDHVDFIDEVIQTIDKGVEEMIAGNGEKLSDDDINQLLSATSANEVSDKRLLKKIPTKKLSKVRKGFDTTKLRKNEKALNEKEVDQLLQSVMTSEMDNGQLPTMAQAMGIKFDHKPTYSEVVAKVESTLDNKQEPTKNTQPDRTM